MKRWNQALCVLSGCLLSTLTLASDIPQIKVAVTDKQCEPMNLTVPAGKVRFIITNKSMRALEWEILNGVMVVAERENIAPGFYQKMTVDLEPGTYETTCGLLTNPHGSLVVQGDNQGPYQIKTQDKIQITAEYKFYLILLSRQLEKAASHWQKAPVSDAEQTLYYQLQTLAGAYPQADHRNLLSKDETDRLKQIRHWTKQFRGQTLQLPALLTRFENLLNQQLTHFQQQAIQTNLSKMLELFNPLLKKAAPDLADRLATSFSGWRQYPSQESRERLRQDLKALHQFIHQGEA